MTMQIKIIDFIGSFIQLQYCKQQQLVFLNIIRSSTQPMRQLKYFIQTQNGKLQLSKGNFIALKNKKKQMQKNSNSKSLTQSIKRSQSRNSSPIKTIQKTLVRPITRSSFITPKKQKIKNTFKKDLSLIYQDSVVYKNSTYLFKSSNYRNETKNQDDIHFDRSLDDNFDFSVQKITGNYKPSISKFECQLEQTQFKSVEQLSLTKDQISIQQFKIENNKKDRQIHKNEDKYCLQNPQNMYIQSQDWHMEEQTTWNQINQNVQNLSIDLALATMNYR